MKTETMSKDYKANKNPYKETFFGRIFQKIIENDIPIRRALNYILMGYLVGIVLTIMCYNYIPSIHINIRRWLFLIILGLILIIFSYSRDIRCIAAISIPILCSSKGRSIIIALAFFLVAIGPTMNMFHNIDVMVSSLSCGQMQLKHALGEILDTLKKPIVAVKDAILNAVKDLRNVLGKFQEILINIQDLVTVILGVMKASFGWLRNIVGMCNREFGTPYERCMNISHNAIEDCKEKLGPLKGLCQVTHIFSMLCYTTKLVDVICVLVVFVNESIVTMVMEKLQIFTAEVKRLFDVSITFDHDFHFKTTTSKELEEIQKAILIDIRQRMNMVILIFGWLDFIGLFMFVIIIVKAMYFRLKYLRNPGYQNSYITKEFLEIDDNRRSMNEETVMPLTYLEKIKYPRLTDCLLTRDEWLAMARSGIFLFISMIQLFCICFADYSLFWILAMISYYGHKELGFTVPPYITVEVEGGGGLIGEIFEGIIHAFEPVAQNYTMNPQTCLPKPRSPNYEQYYLIGGLCFIAWIFLFCQPYALRLRHIIMRLYYPDVARHRAIWLYDRILLKRVTFLKLARRKARIIFTNDRDGDDFSFLDWLRGQSKGKFNKCLLCATSLNDSSRVKCETIGCMGLYCRKCFEASINICCLCHNPVDYRDFSDTSEVVDSSDDPDVVHTDESDECLNRKWNAYIE
ncbi:DC-STAMP domain-containing protein 2 [Haematobia irritans]|uniref:DC-STAMP domain-containing protein 2 n=1 Tax=Haematobia irritans TaxID=7368 RepID=UPI003F503575